MRLVVVKDYRVTECFDGPMSECISRAASWLTHPEEDHASAADAIEAMYDTETCQIFVERSGYMVHIFDQQWMENP